jgi:hypothetical protein
MEADVASVSVLDAEQRGGAIHKVYPTLRKCGREAQVEAQNYNALFHRTIRHAQTRTVAVYLGKS